MKVIVTQPVGTQLFFNVDENMTSTIGDIASLIEQEEGIPAEYLLFSVGKECWADHSDSVIPFVKNETLELDVMYDLEGGKGIRCETTTPNCTMGICCAQLKCVKSCDVVCCCCEMGCSIM